MSRNQLISLEGNIGSGKSTLLARVEAALNEADGPGPHVRVLPEPVERWACALPSLGGDSMLHAFYRDGPVNSFAFQMFVLNTRLDQLLEVPVGEAIFSERSMSSHDAIFAEHARTRGYIDDVQWVAYRSWVKTTSSITGEASPSGMVYLRTSPEVCAARIMSRNRGAEAVLPPGLLNELHDAHEAYVTGLAARGVPVLTVNGNFDMSKSDIYDTVRVVVEFVNGLCAENTKQS